MSEPAEVQYVGMAGISSYCQRAVMRYVQFGDPIRQALVLTSDQKHAFLLRLVHEGDVAVKAGFASGYPGEGPKAFAQTLCILQEVCADIEEVEVDSALLDRLDAGALKSRDLETIANMAPVRPRRLHEYVFAILGEEHKRAVSWRQFEPVMPWGLIDPRLMEFAKRFTSDTEADKAIRDGFRRLEEVLRARTGLKEHGTKLIQECFSPSQPKLAWDISENSEQVGRMQLFTGAFMAFRNPRAHKELESTRNQLWNEFLLLNHLFALEAAAKDVGHP
jgi:uncharacterized protein (TIGR02391 family)